MLIRLAQIEDAGSIARVHVDSWRSTYQGLIDQTTLNALSHKKRKDLWDKILNQDNQLAKTYVLEEENRGIIGFVSGGPNRDESPRYDAEIYAIYLFNEAQGKGYGKELIQSIAKHFTANGLQSMTVWVLADNPAGQFYQHLGAEKYDETTVTIGGSEQKEIGFGWKNLSNL